MKVVCTHNVDKNYYIYSITPGKIYDTIILLDDIIKIKDDNNDSSYYYEMKWFKPLSDIREEKLNDLLK